MNPTGSETEEKPKECSKEDPTQGDVNDTGSSVHTSIFSQQYSASEGGISTDMFCPTCGDTISGTFLPIFRCPHCEILIWRDDKGHVTNYERKHTCPECGHTFNDMTDEAPTEFRRACRNLEQKAEGVFLGLDRIMNRILA